MKIETESHKTDKVLRLRIRAAWSRGGDDTPSECEPSAIHHQRGMTRTSQRK